MPLTYRSTFRYREQVNFSAVTTPQVYVFRLNSPYDPNQTGTGSQPVGWDEMLTFYEQSLCVGSRVEIDLTNTGAAALQLALLPVPQSATVTSYDNALLLTRCKKLFVDGTTKGGTSFSSISHEASILSMFPGGFDRDFIATGNAVPGLQAYWAIALQSPDQATAITCVLQVIVSYDIIWLSRKLVALS